MAFADILLLLATALSVYGTGIIWTMETIVFPSWTMLKDKEEFIRIRRAYWRRLPFLVFIPIGSLFVCTITLLGQHPSATPIPLLWSSFVLQAIIAALTGAFWGRWQARIASEGHGPDSPLLARLVRTSWIRTLLITANTIVLLWAVIVTFT